MSMHFDRLRLLNSTGKKVDEVFYEGFSDPACCDPATAPIQVLPVGFSLPDAGFVDHQTGFVTMRALRILSVVADGHVLADWDITSPEPIAEVHLHLTPDLAEPGFYLASAHVIDWNGLITIQGPVGF